jgi:hypothetical protein
MQDEIKPVGESVAGADEKATQETKAPSQESKYSKKDKLLFTKRKIEEQLKELGAEEEDETKPLTIGMFKKLKQEEATKTALELADTLDETEREEVKELLENTIKPSGDPNQDLITARTLANAKKSTQIVEELKRSTPARTYSMGSSAPAKLEDRFEPTPEEAQFMRPPYNLTKEDIIKARKG